MAKFTRMTAKKGEKNSLSRVTNQLLHEQMVRTTFNTMQGMDRVSSASPDSRHPNRKSQNFVNAGGLRNSNSNVTSTEMNSATQMNGLSQQESMMMPNKTFQEQHSPIHKAMELGDRANLDTSPKVGLEEILRASQNRRFEEENEA